MSVNMMGSSSVMNMGPNGPTGMTSNSGGKVAPNAGNMMPGLGPGGPFPGMPPNFAPPPFGMPPPTNWSGMPPPQWPVGGPPPFLNKIPTALSNLPTTAKASENVVPTNSLDPILVGKAAEWTEHKAPDGRSYFHNAKTSESVWEKPQALKDLEG